MINKQIVIYGAGKLAEFIYYSFQNDSDYEVVAFCIDQKYEGLSPKQLFNIPILNFENVLLRFPPQEYLMHVAVGRNRAREAIFKKVSNNGYKFANYISSRANIWPDLIVGQNVFLDQGTQIHPFSVIEDNCILIGAKLGHHSYIESNSLLSCSTLAGNVFIGQNSFLGLNSAVKENVRIGKDNIIGAGCFISKNTDNGTLIHQDMTKQRIVRSSRVVLFK